MLPLSRKVHSVKINFAVNGYYYAQFAEIVLPGGGGGGGLGGKGVGSPFFPP